MIPRAVYVCAFNGDLGDTFYYSRGDAEDDILDEEYEGCTPEIIKYVRVL